MYNALDKCLIRDRNLAIGFFNLAIYNFKCRNYVGKILKNIHPSDVGDNFILMTVW